MSDNFEAALKAVLVHEGGKVDHPKDPGGRTAYGVIQRVYDGYRRNKGLATRDVYRIEQSELQEIYRRQYWNAVMGDRLPPGVSYVVFDGAVNSGPGQSVKWLQRALNVRVDGVIGEATVSAACAHPNHDALVDAICSQRLRFLRALRTWSTFGRGWSGRVSGVRALGKSWASGASVSAVSFLGDFRESEDLTEAGAAKGFIEDAKGKPTAAYGDAAAGGGVATGGLGGVLQQAQDTLSPYASVSAWIQRIVIVLVILGFVATIGGFAYSRWARARAAARADALDMPVRA